MPGSWGEPQPEHEEPQPQLPLLSHPQEQPQGEGEPSTALVAVANAADPGVTPRSKADLPPVVLLMARAVVSARHETMTMPTAIRIHHR